MLYCIVLYCHKRPEYPASRLTLSLSITTEHAEWRNANYVSQSVRKTDIYIVADVNAPDHGTIRCVSSFCVYFYNIEQSDEQAYIGRCMKGNESP